MFLLRPILGTIGRAIVRGVLALREALPFFRKAAPEVAPTIAPEEFIELLKKEVGDYQLAQLVQKFPSDKVPDPRYLPELDFSPRANYLIRAEIKYRNVETGEERTIIRSYVSDELKSPSDFVDDIEEILAPLYREKNEEVEEVKLREWWRQKGALSQIK
jgi:hypothetical protein